VHPEPLAPPLLCEGVCGLRAGLRRARPETRKLRGRRRGERVDCALPPEALDVHEGLAPDAVVACRRQLLRGSDRRHRRLTAPRKPHRRKRFSRRSAAVDDSHQHRHDGARTGRLRRLPRPVRPRRCPGLPNCSHGAPQCRHESEFSQGALVALCCL